ncbi:MAG: putative molybdenum carrier protein [Gammaproteobacteria bacterium]
MAEEAAPRHATFSIVSGGQTGVDQGALDAASDRGVSCGGWCPEGRRSEAGMIPARYPVRELAGSGYSERTRQNVVDSDGTAIIFNALLEGGTRLTAEYCEQERRPHVLIDAATLSRAESVEVLGSFIRDNDIDVLNVAGPRASKWPDAHAVTHALLTELLKCG